MLIPTNITLLPFTQQVADKTHSNVKSELTCDETFVRYRKCATLHWLEIVLHKHISMAYHSCTTYYVGACCKQFAFSSMHPFNKYKQLKMC